MKLEKDIKNCKRVHDPTRDTGVRVFKNRNFEVGVEIGVQYGLSAEKWLDNNVVKKLYGIDPYNTEIYRISPLNGMDEVIYQYALEKLSRFGNRFTMIRKTSNEALLDIRGQVDFVYVDGAKGKSHIVDDYSYWYTKLREGGVLCGNDYNHPSRPFINRFLTKYFPDIHAEENDFWWVEKKKTVNNGKITVVTPWYNTACYAESLIALPIADPRIDEMIIIDDCSEEKEYEGLLQVVNNHPKIKVFRNKENLGEFKTRIKAVQMARNKWVIFLDGDNILTTEYLDAITNIPLWRENVIYGPDFGSHHKINYHEFDGDFIGLGNLRYYLNNCEYTFMMMMGTGNYFINKKAYLKTAIPISNIDKDSYGDYYFNLEWLKRNLMFVVPGMRYIHRMRKNSSWMEHKHTIQRQTHKSVRALKRFMKNSFRDRFTPMMADREIDYIDRLLEELKPKNCLEWGSGKSTVYFPIKHPDIQKWTAIEHGHKWFKFVNVHKDRKRVEIQLRGADTYVNVDGKYDFILIDGILRNECLVKARELLNPGGVILLHDSSRDEYDLSMYENKEIIFEGEMTNEGVHRGITKLWM